MFAFPSPDNKQFDALLKDAANRVTEDSAREFYANCVKCVGSSKSSSVIDSILISVTRKQNFNIFLSSGSCKSIILAWPSQKKQIFRLFNEIVKFRPDFFDKEVVEAASNIFLCNPIEFASFFAEFANQYPNSKDPWSLMDFVLKNRKKITDEAAEDLASSLTFLFRKHKTVLQYRGEYIWKFLVYCLEKASCSPLMYRLLSVCSDCKVPYPVPVHIVKEHLKKEEFYVPVVSYLLLSQEPPTDPEIASFLLHRAKKEEKSLLILMNAATREEFATLLVKDLSWLKVDLIDSEGSLRLFLVMYQHKSLRSPIRKSRHFFPFLVKLVLMRQAFSLSLVSTILRRSRPDESDYSMLIKSNLIKTYCTEAEATNTAEGWHSFLLFADCVSVFGDRDEISDVARCISKIIKLYKELFEAAVTVAVKMLGSQQSLAYFGAQSVMDVLNSNREHPRLRRAVNKLITAVELSK